MATSTSLSCNSRVCNFITIFHNTLHEHTNGYYCTLNPGTHAVITLSELKVCIFRTVKYCHFLNIF